MSFFARKLTAAALVLGGMISTFAAPTQAAAWQSSDKWGRWENQGYFVQNDVWGANPGPQTIYANYFGNWWVTCNHSGGGIKSYPATGKFVNTRVNSLQYLTSNFSATIPSGTVYDLAYDIWLDGTTYEVMIWQKWSGTKPIAASYDSSGNAIPTQTNVSIGGVTYNVYKRNNVISFLRTSQVTSSNNIDVKAVLTWINGRGWYSNPILRDVQFGYEIISTGGSKTFTINSYNCNFK